MDTRPCIFALHSGAGDEVAARLGESLAALEVRDFEDGEHKTRPMESVRDRDVFVLSSLYGDSQRSVNDRLVQTLLFLGALRDAGAGRLTAVFPYLCYARKDRRTKARDPVSTRHVARMIEAMGVDRVVTLDVHNLAAFENAFRVPVDHLSAGPILVARLLPYLGNPEASEVVVISPDTGGIKRAEKLRDTLEGALGRPVDRGFMEKRRSCGIVSGDRLVGEVRDRVVVLADDLISSGGTLVRAAVACERHGARRILAAATHAPISADAGRTLAASPLERLLVTDTIPVPRPGYPAFDRLEVVQTAPFLAEVVRRLHASESLSELADASALNVL